MATPKNQSVMKAFRMLRSFRQPHECLTSAELSRRAGLPEASGYRLIQTLEEIGAVVRGPKGRYRPGMLLVSLSHKVAVAELLPQASQAILHDLAAKLQLTVHMGVLEDGMVTYVVKEGSSAGISVHTQVGSQLEAYCSGLGKVLLAGLPDAEVESFLRDGDLVPLTPHTIVDQLAFLREIGRIRRHGYAIDDREISEDLRCVAVPVCDTAGHTVAAISVSVAAARMDEGLQADMRSALLTAAAAISRKVYPQSPMHGILHH